MRVAQAQSELQRAEQGFSRAHAAINTYIEQGDIQQFQQNGQIFLRPLTQQGKQLLEKYEKAITAIRSAQSSLTKAIEVQTHLQADLEKKYRKYSHVTLGAAGTAIAVASAVAVWMINRRMRPSINLTEIMAKIVSPADAKNMKVSWSKPWLELASEWLYVNRILVNIALAIFSSQRLAYLTSAAFQGLSLFKISQLHWVQIERTFLRPHGAI